MPASTIPAFCPWNAPESLVESFAATFRVRQQEQAREIRRVAEMARRLPEAKREFLADDLALVMNVHPRTAASYVHTAVTASAVPGLLEAMERGEITDRHVTVAVDELRAWAGDDDGERAAVWALVEQRVRARLTMWDRWPTPGELRRRIRAAALLRDLTAAERARTSVADKRGVHCFQSAVGEGTFSISGPELQVVAIAEAVRARAEAYGRLPGDVRTLDQRMFDAAYDLLLVDAEGGESTVPALDADGVPVTLRVRGVEFQVLVPYSLTRGGELELAEIPGFGPLLPSAAREAMAQAEHLRQVAVDARTGEVLAVEDRMPVPYDEAPPSVERPLQVPQPEPRAAAEPARQVARHDELDPLVAAVLARMLVRPLQHLGPLETDAYRASSRVLRAIRARDRTCCFPGCTTPARWTDGDHRDPWPRGRTSTQNLHCLCRRHHRAKQAYFRVELDEDGNTVWTTPDGRRYRRPPPRF